MIFEVSLLAVSLSTLLVFIMGIILGGYILKDVVRRSARRTKEDMLLWTQELLTQYSIVINNNLEFYKQTILSEFLKAQAEAKEKHFSSGGYYHGGDDTEDEDDEDDEYNSSDTNTPGSPNANKKNGGGGGMKH